MEVTIYKKKPGTTALIPLVGSTIHAGFESPAADYEEESIDLNEHVSKHPYATFYAKCKGDCMNGSGIYNDDLLVVDKSLKPTNGDIVVGMMDGEFILRAYLRIGNDEYLMPDNIKYKPIKRSETTQFEIWGVVPHSVLDQRRRRNVRVDRLQQLLRIM